jgi:hypothetical protein
MKGATTMSATGTKTAKKSAAKKPTLVDAVIANPQPVNAAIAGLVADIKKVAKKATGKKASRVQPAGTAAVAATNGTVPAGEKFCRRHNTTHPLDAFASDRSAKDGKYSICKLAESDDRAAKKAKLAAAAQPAPVAVAATPAPKAKKATKK